MYDSWGQPISAPTCDNPDFADPTDMMPQSTGTIRRVKKRNLKIGGVQVLLIGLGGIAGLVLISSLLGGGNTHSLDEDEAAIASVQPDMAEAWQEPVGLHNLPADLSTLSTEDVERLLHESRQEIQMAHQRYVDAIDSVAGRVTQQRASEWKNFASRECQELNEKQKGAIACINTNDWLLQRLAEEERNLARLAPTGSLPLHRDAIKEFQSQIQTIRELGYAIYGNTGDGTAISESFLPIMQAREGVNLARTKHEALRLALQTRLTQGFGQEMERSLDEP